jgi:hypothetical protein
VSKKYNYLRSKLGRKIKEKIMELGDDIVEGENLLKYYRQKYYRINILKKYLTEEELNNPYPSFFAGIRINSFIIEILENRSLHFVLKCDIEKLKEPKIMGFVIKALRRINKYKNCKRAIVWVRNKFCVHLGRKQAGKKVTDQKQQDIRFYNTYLFKPIHSLDEFLDLTTNQKLKYYIKEYKQLDSELDANYMGRYFSKDIKKYNNFAKHLKRIKTTKAHQLKLIVPETRKTLLRLPRSSIRHTTQKMYDKMLNKAIETCTSFDEESMKEKALQYAERRRYNRNLKNDPPPRKMKQVRKQMEIERMLSLTTINIEDNAITISDKLKERLFHMENFDDSSDETTDSSYDSENSDYDYDFGF